MTLAYGNVWFGEIQRQARKPLCWDVYKLGLKLSQPIPQIFLMMSKECLTVFVIKLVNNILVVGRAEAMEWFETCLSNFFRLATIATTLEASYLPVLHFKQG